MINLLGGAMLAKIIESVISKKRIIGWVSSVLLAAGAIGVGMQADEFKNAVCGAEPIKIESK